MVNDSDYKKKKKIERKKNAANKISSKASKLLNFKIITFHQFDYKYYRVCATANNYIESVA